MLGAVILQVVLIFLNAVFASAEIAVISMSEVKLARLSKEGNRKAQRLLKLTSNPASFLATIQVAITLAGFLGSAYAADNFAGPLVLVLTGLGVSVPESLIKNICVFIITLVIAYFSIVFGELIPKRVAMQKAEGMALGLSGILTAVSRLFRPVVWLLTVSTNGVLRLCGIDPEAEEEVTEEEIRMMAAAGSEKGTIGMGENELIQNVFEFNDIPVEEICTHRVDVILLELEDDMEEWEKRIYESRHNYYPVCGETSDDIVGILDAKDYLRMRERDRKEVMEKAVKKPYFIPETMKANEIFAKMQVTGNYFAVVVDEYGGMSGIVTMRDLVELLLGDLVEPGEESRREIEQIQDGEWRISGTASLDDVAETLKVTLPLDDYDTFSGYICGTLGEVPDDGITFELETEELRIQVTMVQDRRIEEALVTKLRLNQNDYEITS